jgi:hypothetical protein
MGIRMADQIQALIVGRWHVGYAHDADGCVLSFEFTDCEPMHFLMPLDQAAAMAHAILDQNANPPPRRGRLS